MIFQNCNYSLQATAITRSFEGNSAKMRPERNIVTVAASSLLRQSDFGSAQSLPTNISRTPIENGKSARSGELQERYAK